MSHLPAECPHHPCALSVMEHTRRRQNPPVGPRKCRKQAATTGSQRRGHTAGVLPFAPQRSWKKCPPGSTSSRPTRSRALRRLTFGDVRALVANGRLPTIDGRFVAAAHAVEVVRSLRSGSALPAAVPELFQPALAQHREPGVPLAGSALAHAVMLGSLCASDRGRTSCPEVAAVRHHQSGLPGDARTGRRWRGRGSEAARAAPACRASGREPDAKPGRHASASVQGPKTAPPTRASTGSHAGTKASGASASGTEAGASSASCCTRRERPGGCTRSRGASGRQHLRRGQPRQGHRGRRRLWRRNGDRRGEWRGNRAGFRRRNGRRTISAGQRHHAAVAAPRSQARLYRGRSPSRDQRRRRARDRRAK